MNLAYRHRLMAALPGHDPVELHRSHTAISEAVRRFLTRDFAEQWEFWIESVTPERCLLGPRCHAETLNRTEGERLYLTPAEKETAGVGFNWQEVA